jgi:hypothetical protein
LVIPRLAAFIGVVTPLQSEGWAKSIVGLAPAVLANVLRRTALRHVVPDPTVVFGLVEERIFTGRFPAQFQPPPRVGLLR